MTTSSNNAPQSDNKNAKGKSTEQILKDALQSFMGQFKPGKNPAPKTDEVPGVEFEKGTAATIPRKSGSSALLRSARFALYMVAGGIVLSNVQPYVNICGMFGASLAKLGIMPMLLKIPVLGWLLSGGGALTVFIAGLILWFVLQILQMLPVLLSDSPQMMLNLIAWAGQYRAIKTSDDDSEAVANLKRTYNAIPTKWLDDANSARAIAYLIDLFLVMRFYPPIAGGYDRLGVFFAAPQVSDIDLQNVAVGLFAMFGVEVAYKVWKLFNGFIDLARNAAE
jgi:hypothetical protein